MNNIKEHYRELFKKHGPDPASVQYTDRKTQYKRFEILYGIDTNHESICDFGCGLADFYEYIKLDFNYTGLYIGLDFVPEFIKANKLKYKEQPNLIFEEFDLTRDQVAHEYDYGVLSGVFNNKMDNNEEFMYSVINKMFEKAKKGIAFNAMSTYVDYMAENLYYSDPLKVFDFCKKNLSPKVVLRHDYLVKKNVIPFEYCIYVYK